MPSAAGIPGIAERLALLAVPFCAALACTPRLTLEQYELPKHVGLLVLAATMLAAAPTLLSPRRRGAFPPLPAFLAAAVLSAILAPAPLAAFLGAQDNNEGLLTIVIYGLLFAAGTGLGRREATAFRAAALAAAAIGAAWTFVQQAGIAPFGPGLHHHPHGLTGNPDFLAQQMAMALALALGGAAAGRVPLHLALSAIFLAALGLTASRGGALAALAGAGLAAWWTRERWRGRRAVAAAGAVAVAALILAGTGLLASPGLSLADRTAAFVSQDAFPRTRGLMWMGTARVIRDRPLLGLGPDGLPGAFLRHAPPGWAALEGLGISARKAHNELLQSWSVLGAVGTGLYAWLLLSAARLSRRRLADPLDASAAAAAAAFLIHNLLSIGTAATAPVFWVLLGFLCRRETPEDAAHGGRPARIAAALLGAALAIYGAVRLTADASGFRGNEAAAAGDRAGAAAEFARAGTLAPWVNTYLVRRAGALESAGDSAAALPLFEKAAGRDPLNGILLGNVGRVREGLALASGSPADRERALAELMRAVELAPTQPSLIGAVIMALQRAGRTGERDAWVLRLREADPTWAARLLGNRPPAP